MNIAVKRRLLLTLNVVIVLLSAVSIFLPDRYRPHYRGTAILISWLVPIFLAAVCFYLGTRITQRHPAPRPAGLRRRRRAAVSHPDGNPRAVPKPNPSHVPLSGRLAHGRRSALLPAALRAGRRSGHAAAAPL